MCWSFALFYLDFVKKIVGRRGGVDKVSEGDTSVH